MADDALAGGSPPERVTIDPVTPRPRSALLHDAAPPAVRDKVWRARDHAGIAIDIEEEVKT